MNETPSSVLQNTGQKPTDDAEPWSIARAEDLYRVPYWGRGYFDIDASGDVRVRLDDPAGGYQWVSLMDIVGGLERRGFQMPILLRFTDILRAQIREINEAFIGAITDSGYRGSYRGVFPIKVNQQEQVVSEIAKAGRPYHFGLEAGSKAEFVAALAYMEDPDAYLIANGYKDAEMVDLALHARQMGIQAVLVVEMPEELNLILERTKALGIEPLIGVRIKLATPSSGHWNDSGGDRSVFGLTVTQLVEMIDQLRQADRLHCLKLLHYHQGSQIPQIRNIRDAAAEAARIYCSLVEEGAPMGLLDMGGGLAIDYDGTKSVGVSSCNYSIREYCADVIEVFMAAFDAAGIDHPTLISESGRATVAHSSVLLFNVFEVTRFEPRNEPDPPREHASEPVRNLAYVLNHLEPQRIQEHYNDAIYYRDQARRFFQYGDLTLRERAQADNYYWNILSRLARLVNQVEPPLAPELIEIRNKLVEIYHVNFSVFQSLPDAWAIDQVFPVMPIHRLGEEPTHTGLMADITCDCDGKLDNFVDDKGLRKDLPLHSVNPDEDYILGAFIVGAYQETLGDLHNLLGDTNVASVHWEDGEMTFDREIHGDTVAEVLSYLEYDAKDLFKQFRDLAEKAVRKKTITPEDRRAILSAYEASLRNYTYFID
ncbi:MAG: biosynthetic arginine decarboxylase [Opitutales bacterium]